MTIDDYINNFLRDAQYRVGTLSVEIDEMEDDGSTQYQLAFRQRLELTTFMDIVYEGKWYITDSGYNHIQYLEGAIDAEETWTQKEVIQEIEHLRYYTNMNEVPFINFTAHYPQIINGTGGSGSALPPPGSVLPPGTSYPLGAGFPAGLYGQTIFYNISNQPYAEFIDPYGGINTGESITSYFTGRT
jgi:hypothetical protein